MDISVWKERLESWLEPRLPEMLALLETMVSTETCSHDGEDVNRLGDYLANYMREHGFGSLKLPKPPVPEDEPWRANMGNVYTAFSGEPGSGIVIPTHMDTVFPKGTLASWGFRVDADRATGPGVADMKGGILIAIFAARALAALDLLDFPLTLTFSCDEELGSVTSSVALKEYARNGWACICPEPAREENSVIGRSKGSGHLRLRVEGKAAHSSMDYASGASAVIELAQKTLDFDALIDLNREIIVNTGLVHGGTSAGTVAPFAESAIHMSYARMSDGLALLDRIRSIAAVMHVPGTASYLSGGIRLPPLEENEANARMLSLVQNAGRHVGVDIVPAYAKWASEAGFFSSALRLPSVCGMGPVGGGFHSDEEFLIVSSLLPRCIMLALTTLQAARTFTP